MYLSGHANGVKAAVNREISMSAILNQLPELSDWQLNMVDDYIRGLKAADIFLSRT